MQEIVISQKNPAAGYQIGITGMDAILQNIRTIILTSMYSVPLDRAFAHVMDMVDSPAPCETMRLSQALVDAIETYEPRVRVERIDFVPDESASDGLMKGSLAPKVTFALREGVGL